MPAKVLELVNDSLPEKAFEEVLRVLTDGQLIALPTETGYGLVVRNDEDGRARLEHVVGNVLDPAWVSHPNATEDLALVDVQWVPPARRLAEAFWPGPLTLILPSRSDDGWAGHRSPSVPVTRRIVADGPGDLLLIDTQDAYDHTLESGRELARRAGEELSLIVATHVVPSATSTVVRLGRGPLQILREGTITAEHVRRTAGRRVLFVCTGNTCRSPMAAALLRHTLCERLQCTPADLVAMGYRIESAGVAAMPGARASEGSSEALAEIGLSLVDHRSQPVTRELLDSMDHVFALGSRHRNVLLELWPAGRTRIDLLRGDGGDVADPFGGSLGVYRRARDEIAAEVRRLARTL